MIGVRFPWLLARALARFVAPLVLAAVVALLPLAAFAAQITVDGATCTLPDAITAANTDTAPNGCTAGSGADTLLLTAATYSLATGPYNQTATPTVTTTVVISGGVGGAVVQRTGVAHYRLFQVGVAGDLTLQNVTVRYGDVDNFGGGFINSGKVTLTNSDIISNKANSSGGGFINSGTVTLTSSMVAANKTSGAGGGFINYGTVTLTSSMVAANTATSNAGGFYNGVGGKVMLTDSSVISNSVGDSFLDIPGYGGGFTTIDGKVTLTDSDLLSNTSTFSGGGFANHGGTVTITHARILGNNASNSGGALSQGQGTTTIDQSCIVNNSDTAVDYTGGTAIDADNNWWGVSNGPSGLGPGGGDSVSSNVNFAPFLTSAILACPAFRVAFSKHALPAGNLLPGEPLTYTLTITITNESGANVNNLYVTDVLPAAYQLDLTNTTGPAIGFNGRSFVITELLVSQVATINLMGQVAATLNHELLLSNTATLTSSVTDVLTGTTSNHLLMPVVGWSQDAYETDEDSGSFTATVTVSPTNPYITTTVQVVITDSATAIAAAAMQEVTFPPGSSSQPVMVTVAKDGVVVLRTIRLGLQSPIGASLGDGSSADAVLTLIEGDAAPAVVVSKQVNTPQARVGDTITYTYRITNTGNVTLTTVSVVDDKLGAVAALAGALLPNATRTATLAYVVQASDLPGPLTNTVVVTGTDSFGTDVTDSASIRVTLLTAEDQPSSIYLPKVQH